MTNLRLFFPPLGAWLLAGGVIWALGSGSDAPLVPAAPGAVVPPAPLRKGAADLGLTLAAPMAYGDGIATVAQRPLFSETRRPPEPPAPDPVEPVTEAPPEFEQPPQFEPPAFVFKGFFRSDDQVQALIAIPDLALEQWVSVGDTVAEWQIRAMSADFVRLERDGVEHIVEISQ